LTYGLIRLGQQALALIEANRLDVDAGRLGEGADGEDFSRAWSMPLDSVLDYGSKVTPFAKPRKGSSSCHKAETAAVLSLTGGIAALLASTCCLGPLVLVALGFRRLDRQPDRARAVPADLHRRGAVALYFAWRRIFRPAHACHPNEVCAVPQVRTRLQDHLLDRGAALVLVALAFPYVLPLFY
jgi:mercuric ion transport protein